MRATTSEQFWAKVKKTEGCWEWTGRREPDSYGRIGWKGCADYAHHVAWLLTRGEIPEGLCVLHECDNPVCVNPDHLWLGTQGDNGADKARKKRARGGYRAPLPERVVDSIRTLCEFGASQRGLALAVGVHQTAIGKMVRRGARQ